MDQPIDAVIGDLARRQHGLITRRQAFALGLNANAIGSRRRSGRWLTVESGVYIINGAPLTWRARLLALCLALDGSASHRSGASLLDVESFPPGFLEITVPRGRFVHRDGVQIHKSTDMHLFVPQIIDGIPTTPVPRLIVDLGAVVSFERYDRAVHDLIRRKLLTWETALHQLIQHSVQGRNGVGALRLLVEDHFGDDVAESVLEVAFLRELRRRRLPVPVSQFAIYDRDGFIARVDFCYPRLKIIVELDGRRFHDDPAFESDRDKRDRLVTEGWAVLEVTWKMLLHEPQVVFRRLEKLIADAPSRLT